ncbi:MAG: hypothetical protein EP315_08760 [Gammaproteobacteria bacterium]|nr:MAG: hypothetical protein EP315_08760 [Gammaproteobacteria bacterium]
MDDFIIRAVLVGILVVMMSGPMGCVVVWRRMAYFGDTLAHAALLGTALAIVFDLNPTLGVLLTGVLLSLLLVMLQRAADLSIDTLLGILAHGALAIGLVLLAILQHQGLRIDFMAYLFGDILAVSWNELGWMLPLVIIVIVVLTTLWRSLLAMAIHEELAQTEGVNVLRVRLLFMMLMALMIAVAMKLVGILLITALLIIPAASARRLAWSPESMALISVGFGVAAVLAGVTASLYWDSPTGPSIVVASLLLFFATRLKSLSL